MPILDNNVLVSYFSSSFFYIPKSLDPIKIRGIIIFNLRKRELDGRVETDTGGTDALADEVRTGAMRYVGFKILSSFFFFFFFRFFENFVFSSRNIRNGVVPLQLFASLIRSEYRKNSGTFQVIIFLGF